MRRCYHGYVRVLLLLVALTGCGRLGFGESSPSDGMGSGGDALGDGPVGMPQLCDDTVVTTLGGINPVAIRAAALSTGGYAVALETTAPDIKLLELDANKNLVATHSTFAVGYAPLYGLSLHNDLPMVSLETGGTTYLKVVDPGWDTYLTGLGGDPRVVDPAYAEISPTQGIAGLISGGDFNVGIFDDANFGTVTVADYVPTTVESASIVPAVGGARVVVEKTGGVCETFVVTDGNMVKNRHTFSPCYAPKAATASGTAVILHRIDTIGPYAVHIVPPVDTDPGETFTLTGATYARIAGRGDDTIWVGHGSGSYRAMIRFDNGARTELREQTPAYPFDLTSRDAFWIEGPIVHVATPCLK